MKRFRFTDQGNAERMVHHFGEKFRHNHNPHKQFYVWDGTRWRPDDTNEIYRIAQEVVWLLHKQAEEIEDVDVRKMYREQANRLESLSCKKNMITLSSTLKKVAVRLTELDANPWLFNCQNCTLDLSKGHVSRSIHNPRDQLTKISPVVYDPDAEYKGFLMFLLDVFDCDTKLIRYVQQLVGYSLTGDVSEEILLFAHGEGKNGKSRFFDAMELLFGEYFYKSSNELVMKLRNNTTPRDVINIQGKRLVICSELSHGDVFSESTVKDLTGGDTIRARGLYKNPVNFPPTHTLWIYGNHRPRVVGTDLAIWRRIKLIPFHVIIQEKDKKPKRYFVDMFRKELSGILNWALEGYVDYCKNGFKEPECVRLAIDEYRAEEDTVCQFLQQCCKDDSDRIFLAVYFYEVYKKWCEDLGMTPENQRTLYKRLRDKGYKVKTGTGNRMMIYGLELDS